MPYKSKEEHNAYCRQYMRKRRASAKAFLEGGGLTESHLFPEAHNLSAVKQALYTLFHDIKNNNTIDPLCKTRTLCRVTECLVKIFESSESEARLEELEALAKQVKGG